MRQARSPSRTLHSSFFASRSARRPSCAAPSCCPRSPNIRTYPLRADESWPHAHETRPSRTPSTCPSMVARLHQWRLAAALSPSAAVLRRPLRHRPRLHARRYVDYPRRGSRPSPALGRAGSGHSAQRNPGPQFPLRQLQPGARESGLLLAERALEEAGAEAGSPHSIKSASPRQRSPALTGALFTITVTLNDYVPPPAAQWEPHPGIAEANCRRAAGPARLPQRRQYA